MALTFDDDDLWLLRKCILAALELLRAHRASEDIFDLDGFVEYVAEECEALRRLLVRCGATNEELDDIVGTPLDQYVAKVDELVGQQHTRRG